MMVSSTVVVMPSATSERRNTRHYGERQGGEYRDSSYPAHDRVLPRKITLIRLSKYGRRSGKKVLQSVTFGSCR
jgi:hypothetical protein